MTDFIFIERVLTPRTRFKPSFVSDYFVNGLDCATAGHFCDSSPLLRLHKVKDTIRKPYVSHHK